MTTHSQEKPDQKKKSEFKDFIKIQSINRINGSSIFAMMNERYRI